MGTIAFLKTDKKWEFYWVDSNNNPREITPVEAFKIFEANENEPSVVLIFNHYEQVNKAMEYFETTEYKLVQSQTDPEALGGVAQNAKKFLSVIINHPKITEQQREKIQKIILLIDIGKYTNLPSDIDKLQRKRLNLEVAILEIDKISERYNINLSDAQKGNQIKLEKPILIISESFE